MAGLYCVNLTRVAVTTAATIIQIKAGASNPLEITRASVSQSLSTTSTQLPIQIMRKSAAGTVTSFTPLKLHPDAVAAFAVGGTAATGTNASAEGTDSDVLVQEVFNYLSGWYYLPVPEARIQVPVGGILGLKLPVAPGSSVTLTAQIEFREL